MAEFVDTDQLGQAEWREPQQFDAVTCMFAIHYFFVSERALDAFLHNVAINLKDGAVPVPGPALSQSACHSANMNHPALSLFITLNNLTHTPATMA
jgi:hypothetical protein